MEPVAQETILGGGVIARQEALPAGNSPFNYRPAESKLYCNEICNAGQGAAGLLISQIRAWEPSRLVRVVKFFFGIDRRRH